MKIIYHIQQIGPGQVEVKLTNSINLWFGRDRVDKKTLKPNMTLENPPCSIGNTSSNRGCSIAMLVFLGGYSVQRTLVSPVQRVESPEI